MKTNFLILIILYLIEVSYQQLGSLQSSLSNGQSPDSQNNFHMHTDALYPQLFKYNPSQFSSYSQAPAAPQNKIDQNLPKYICSLQYNGKEECKCIITGRKTVVTAAHCTYEKNANYYQVAIRSNVEKIFNIVGSTTKHFIYQYPYFDDIIQLTLQTEIPTDAQIVQIPTAEDCDKFPYGQSATIWIPNDQSSNLNALHVRILNNTDLGCNNYVQSRKITQTMFCAGWNDGRIDPCKAVDGSPLIYKNKLFGVASWGKGCKRPTQASVYANYCKFAYDYRNYEEEDLFDYENDY